MQHSRFIGTVAASLMALTLGASAALAGPSDNSLNWVWDREDTTLDVYYRTDHNALSIVQNVWDTLIYRDPESDEYQPLLATSWEWETPTSLVFKLRQDVVFHNGEPFDADDVVATLNYVSTPANGVLLLQMVGWIKSAEKIDQYTVRINLKEAQPFVLEYLATGVPIYPNEYYAEVGTDGMGREPVGTGPYRVTSFEPSKGFELARNENYFADSVKSGATIDTIRVRTQVEANMRIGELMTQSADFAYRLTSDQADQLEMMPGIQIVRQPSMTLQFLTFETQDPESPLANRLVREAIAHAINRDSIVENLARGGAERLDTPCYPMQIACSDEGVLVRDYNPERARELLAEAGYPDGFTIPIEATNQRDVIEAIIGDLAAVGITANLDFMVWGPFRERWVNGELNLFHSSSGMWGIGDASIVFGTYFNEMPQDRSRDPIVTDLITRATSTFDLEERTALYLEASKRIIDEVYWLPLMSTPNNYAMAEHLVYQPTYDSIVRFYDMNWN